jgi:hypothetical protein
MSFTGQYKAFSPFNDIFIFGTGKLGAAAKREGVE